MAAGDSSLEVLGVLEETRLEGRQYGVPRFSPFLRPHGFPVETSFQSSLNHLLSANPLLVFLTAIYYLAPFAIEIIIIKNKPAMTEVEQQLLQRMQRLEKDVQNLKEQVKIMDKRKS